MPGRAGRYGAKYTIFDAFGSSYQNYAREDCHQRDNDPVYGRMKSDLYGRGWPVMIPLIPQPADTRLVRDAIPFHIRNGKNSAEVWHWNELFADGHVQTIKSSETRGGLPQWGFSYDTGGIL
jgi:hypothetical protein